MEAHAADEREALAVGRRRRPDRAPGPGDERLVVAGFAIDAVDRVDLRVGILAVLERVSRRAVAAVVDVAAAVRRERGLAQIFLVVGTLVELQAAAAAPVIEPDLARAQRPPRREVLARRDEFAVGTPHGRVEQAKIFVRHRFGVAAVTIHDPDVVAATAVAGERDRLPVGAVTRLHVPGESGGQSRGLAAVDRDRVQVAQ